MKLVFWSLRDDNRMFGVCWAHVGAMLGPCWAHWWAMLSPSLATWPILGPFNINVEKHKILEQNRPHPGKSFIASNANSHCNCFRIMCANKKNPRHLRCGRVLIYSTRQNPDKRQQEQDACSLVQSNKITSESSSNRTISEPSPGRRSFSSINRKERTTWT
jgi:hypothetical protein